MTNITFTSTNPQSTQRVKTAMAATATAVAAAGARDATRLEPLVCFFFVFFIIFFYYTNVYLG